MRQPPALRAHSTGFRGGFQVSRLYTCLLAVLVASSGALVALGPALASTGPTPPPKQTVPDVFRATVARQGDRQTGPGTHPNAASKSREIPGMRTRNSRTQATNDGYVTEIYSNSIHFRDARGDWQPIDDTLVPANTPGYAVKNKSNGYTALLPNSLSSPVSFGLPAGTIQFQIVGATGSPATSGQTATYAKALNGATVTYAAQSDSLKEAISLANSASPTTFTYKLQLPTKWSARATGQGGIDVVDAAGQVQASFKAPYMYDSSRTSAGYSRAVSLTLSGNAGSQTITMSADSKWIAAPGRQFPVVIDPSIATNVNYYDPHDCFIQNTNPTGSFCSSQGTTTLTANPLGFDGTTINRNLYWFGASTTRYSIPAPNSNILDAELDFTLASSSSTSAVPVTVYPITQAWDDAGASWNNANTGVPWTTAGGTVGSAITTVNVGPTAGSFAIYNLTSTIQNWVNGNTTDNGFLLRATNESTNALLQIDNDNFGTSSTDPSRPHLRVQWNGWGGLQPFFTFVTTQVDDRMSIAVNMANGQLVVHNHDLGVQGVGLNLSVDRYYNSLSDIQWHLGTGWNLTAGCDVRIDLDDHDGVTYWSPDGYQVLFRNNGSGGYVTPPGVNADLIKNGDGTLTLAFHKSGLKYNFQTGGCLQNEVDRNGNTLSMSYNGSLQTLTDTENRATTFSYNSTFSSDFITQMTDSAGRAYKYSYDGNGNLTSYTDSNNKVTRYAYNSNSQMNQVTDPNGNVINFTYGTAYPQPLTQVSYVDASCVGGTCNTSFSYNNGSGPCTSSGIAANTVVTDGNGHNGTLCFDNLGRVIEVRDANNHKRTNSWSTNYDVASTTDNMGNVTSYVFDSNFNLRAAQNPASAAGQTAATQNWNYNTPTTVNGHLFLPSSAVDPMTNCGAFTYDPSGNTTSGYLGQSGACDGQTGGTNTCTAYQGDPSGTCGATAQVTCSNAKNGEACWVQDGDGHRTSFAYDSAGNISTVTPPSPSNEPLGQTTFTVDALARVTSSIDGKGQKTSYFYDSLDRMTEVLFAGATSCGSYTTCTVYGYDANGNLANQTDSTGAYTFHYNARNMLTQKVFPANSPWGCPGQTATITMGYDNAGNLTSYCDVDGSVTYYYDGANRLTGAALPTGSCSSTPQVACTGYTYDSDDRLTRLTFPGAATQNYSYDNAGNLLTAIGKNSSGAVVTGFTYTYVQVTTPTVDRAVRLSVAENDMLVSNLTTSYSYDSLLRLTQASNSQHTWNYSYDAAGNRISDPSGSFQFNAANEMCGANCASPSYHFDGAGNLTNGPGGASLSYNAQNQTTAATWGGQSLTGLAYAGAGQAERTAVGSSTFASSPMGLQDVSSSGSITSFLRDPGGNLLGEETADDSHWYYLKDGLGSTIAVINDSGATVADTYMYDPFGGLLSSSGTVANPWRYAGGYTDSTGLVKFGMRYYDPILGRWTQTEPTQAAPAFAYAGDDPVNLVDPTGQDVNWGALVNMAEAGAEEFLTHKGWKIFGKSFALAPYIGPIADVGTNAVSAYFDYRDVNASWTTKVEGIALQTWIDTSVDYIYEGAFAGVGFAIGDVPGAVIGAVLGAGGATIVEDNAINPCFQGLVVSGSFSACP